MPRHRIFLTRTFARWQAGAGLENRDLIRAVAEMTMGLVDAELGTGLVKKRIGLRGTGKRGGARVLVATRFEDNWFFVYGFAKNERDDIDRRELLALRELAGTLLRLSHAEIARAKLSGSILEIIDE